jgi:zinc transport system substrate-binding protein
MPSLATRTRALPILALLLAGPALVGCGALSGDDSSGDGPRIAAAFYPLQYVAERVAGEHYGVDNLTRPGVEPHDLALGVRETADISDAALVLHEHGFQPAVDEAVEQNATGAVLDVTDVIELEATHEPGHDEHGHDDGEDGHDHGDLDPHFWQDPLLMAQLGDAVADQLAELDPDHADEYAANAADLRTDLENLDQEYADGLADCARDTVVVNHDAFGYLGRYGLHIEPIAGLSPDAEPTPADLGRLHDLIRDEGITTVFSETLVSKKTAQTLAADLGIETAVLDPLEGLSDDDAGADYLSVMRKNLAAITRANGCR